MSLILSKSTIIYAFPTTGKTYFGKMLEEDGYTVFDTDDFVTPEDTKEMKANVSEELYNKYVEMSKTEEVVILTSLSSGKLFEQAEYCFLPEFGRLNHFLKEGRVDLEPYKGKFSSWERSELSKVIPSGLSTTSTYYSFCSPMIGNVKARYSVQLKHDSFISDYFIIIRNS